LGTALKIKDAKCQLLEMISPVILLLAAVSAAPFPPQFATQYTQAHLVKVKAPMASSTVPSALRQQQLVHNLIGQIDPILVEKHLIRLTEFPERYYESKNGALAGQWLFDEVVALNSSASPDVLLTVRMFKHRKWQQPSVIARLEARNGAANDIVITGTHFDTAGYGTGRPEPIKNPGADDCASGSSVIAETLRVLVKSGFVPYRPIEFHWYAAEEFGLLGSREVATDYAKRKVDVLAYLNLDQSGYVKKGTTPTIGIMTDFTDAKTTALLRATVREYTTVTKVVDTACGCINY
jgi:bacterial leucyl aminopeptidase